MKCIDINEVTAFMEGQLSPEEEAAASVHFERCSSCAALLHELTTLTGRLAPSTGEFDDPDLANDVMMLIRLGQAKQDRLADTAPGSTSRLWIPGAVVLLAASVAIVIAWPGLFGGAPLDRNDSPSQFQARGGSGETESRWISIKIFRTVNSDFVRVEDSISSNDSLAFAYMNRAKSRLKYLMIFAVDEEGRFFWYYPENNKRDERAMSIPIEQTDSAIQLPDSVSHDLTPGGLKLMALFSAETIEAAAVEQVVREDLERAGSLEKLNEPNIGGAVSQIFHLDVVAAGNEADK